MKHFKEIRVGVLAVIAAFILYFGFNFLKGINIFNKTNTYVARFDKMNGLVEQSPVYVQGYKVGMVDEITYDFSKPEPFVVTFSINRDILIPKDGHVALVADGLINGEALDLRIPVTETDTYYTSGDTIPSSIEPDLIAELADALTDRFDPVIHNLDSILNVIKKTLDEQKLASIVNNVDGTIKNAKGITAKVDNMLGSDIPMLLDSIQLVVNDLHQVSGDLADANLKGVILKLDTTVNSINGVVETLNSTDGTIGMLLNDRDLYISLNNTVQSADSLLVDLKANPKRYVHFSLFGSKDKKKK